MLTPGKVSPTRIKGDTWYTTGHESIPERNLSISASKVAWVLTAVTALLVMLHIISVILEFRLPPEAKIRRVATQFFNLGEEGNFPTFFSALILLLASLICFYIHYAEQTYLKRTRKHWMILASAFLFLSFDEAIQIHEQSMVVVHYLMPKLPAMFASAWVIPYAIIAVLAALYFLKFIISLPSRTRNLFIVAGFVFVTGALLLEVLEAILNEKYGTQNFLFLSVITLQETMEMIGVTIFIYGLLDYIATYHQELKIKVKSRSVTGFPLTSTNQ
jgi:hypothetical protein